MKLFVEDMKGYMDVYEDVFTVKIKKVLNKNCLIIRYGDLKKPNEIIKLSEIRLAFMIDPETTREYFRYAK